MRKLLLLSAALMLPSVAAGAEQPRAPKPYAAAPSSQPLPVKRPAAANACAQYGAGFIMIEGTGTCMKIGGAIGIGGGISSGSR